MSTSPEGIPDLDTVLQNGSNKSALTCLHCTSRILNPSVGSYVEKEVRNTIVHYLMVIMYITDILLSSMNIFQCFMAVCPTNHDKEEE